MSNLDIARAWKDEDYRNSLSTAELAMLPKNPVGMMELTESELDAAVGGRSLIAAKTKTKSTGDKSCSCECKSDAAAAAPVGIAAVRP